MKKLKIMQFSFLLTAVIATVLLLCVSFDTVLVLHIFSYYFFILIPQAVAIIFQLYIVKKKLAEHIQAVKAWKNAQHAKERKPVHFAITVIGALHTIAELKSMGINPNRAGPFKVFA